MRSSSNGSTEHPDVHALFVLSVSFDASRDTRHPQNPGRGRLTAKRELPRLIAVVLVSLFTGLSPANRHSQTDGSSLLSRGDQEVIDETYKVLYDWAYYVETEAEYQCSGCSHFCGRYWFTFLQAVGS